MFSAAQFLDVFNNRYVHAFAENPLIAHPPHVLRLFPAIPIISENLSFAPSETVWIVSAYQLTFASLLVVRPFPTQRRDRDRANNAMKSGRISDVYSPKPAFVSSTMILALTHLGAGFVRHKIAPLVFRALGGIGSAMTIPSALSMIVALIPDQRSQGRAIAVFGGTGGVGNGEFIFATSNQQDLLTLGFQQFWD